MPTRFTSLGIKNDLTVGGIASILTLIVTGQLSFSGGAAIIDDNGIRGQLNNSGAHVPIVLELSGSGQAYAQNPLSVPLVCRNANAYISTAASPVSNVDVGRAANYDATANTIYDALPLLTGLTHATGSLVARNETGAAVSWLLDAAGGTNDYVTSHTGGTGTGQGVVGTIIVECYRFQ